jgi:hypothetical protein
MSVSRYAASLSHGLESCAWQCKEPQQTGFNSVGDTRRRLDQSLEADVATPAGACVHMHMPTARTRQLTGDRSAKVHALDPTVHADGGKWFDTTDPWYRQRDASSALVANSLLTR